MTDRHNFTVSLGHRLRMAREASGISQKMLAACVGMSQPQLSRIEAGDYMPNLMVLCALCKEIETPIERIIPNEWTKHPSFSTD